ncbi:MAG: cytochrome-c peroxidase [Limisphaerales bacterium]
MQKLLPISLVAGILSGVTSLTAADAKPDVAALRAQALELVGAIPDKMPGAENDTPAMIELGRQLYFDNRLSMNDSQSCNTCHVVDNKGGGVDNQPTSPGAFGKRGDRNSPTTLNAGFHFVQFWDGRAKDLFEQAKGPILNPVEMAMPAETEVVKKLAAVPEYQAGFAKVFPASAEKISYDNIANAIAAFERTLITRDRFDDFQKGDDQALSEIELKGADLFLNSGCTTCHNGPVMGGNTFQKVGLIHKYETPDKGRAVVTEDEDDEYKFKVPSLRNIALTAPYFHNGKHTTLREAVKLMGHHQLDRQFTDAELDALIAFMNALTDKDRVK